MELGHMYLIPPMLTNSKDPGHQGGRPQRQLTCTSVRNDMEATACVDQV